MHVSLMHERYGGYEFSFSVKKISFSTSVSRYIFIAPLTNTDEFTKGKKIAEKLREVQDIKFFLNSIKIVKHKKKLSMYGVKCG